MAVASLLSCIYWSTNCYTVVVILESRPDPGRLAMDCVSSYTFRIFAIPRLDAKMPSFFSSRLAIVYGLYPVEWW